MANHNPYCCAILVGLGCVPLSLHSDFLFSLQWTKLRKWLAAIRPVRKSIRIWHQWKNHRRVWWHGERTISDPSSRTTIKTSTWNGNGYWRSRKTGDKMYLPRCVKKNWERSCCFSFSLALWVVLPSHMTPFVLLIDCSTFVFVTSKFCTVRLSFDSNIDVFHADVFPCIVSVLGDFISLSHCSKLCSSVVFMQEKVTVFYCLKSRGVALYWFAETRWSQGNT